MILAKNVSIKSHYWNLFQNIKSAKYQEESLNVFIADRLKTNILRVYTARIDLIYQIIYYFANGSYCHIGYINKRVRISLHALRRFIYSTFIGDFIDLYSMMSQVSYLRQRLNLELNSLYMKSEF